MWESLSHSSKKKDLGSKVHTWWPRVAVRVNWVGDRLGCLACTEAKIAIVDWRVAPLSGYQQPRLHASANRCWGVLKPVKCIVDGSALRECDYVQSFYLCFFNGCSWVYKEMYAGSVIISIEALTCLFPSEQLSNFLSEQVCQGVKCLAH